MNTTIARPGLSWGGFYFAHVPLYPPAASRRLCGLLWPAGGIFTPVASRAGARPKRKTAVKAICRPYTALYCPSSISIFPRRQTAHKGPQADKQGINQPRPAPSWSKPGLYHLFRAALFVSIPPGAAVSITSPSDVLRAGRLRAFSVFFVLSFRLAPVFFLPNQTNLYCLCLA